MPKIDTLTAYSCRFRYFMRNNPLMDDPKKNINLKGKPEFTFEDFLNLYKNSTGKMHIGINTDRAIALFGDNIDTREISGLKKGEVVKSWFISPCAGKQGKPMTIMNGATGESRHFGSDFAALYNHNVLFYEGNYGLTAIFHRQSGSGCKSVFLETANNVLRPEGLKMDMDVIIPTSDEASEATPVKLTLKCFSPNISSDIADNIRRRSGKQVLMRSTEYNLEMRAYSSITRIIQNIKQGKISSKEGFAELHAEIKDAGDFNDAEVSFKVGRGTKRVPFDDFERIIGMHDISRELHTAYAKSKDFKKELTKLADEYYYSIIKGLVTE